MKNSRKLFSVVVAALSLGIGGGVHANPAGTPDALLPGNTNFINASPGVYNQFFVAGVFLAKMISPFSGAPVFSGLLTTFVIHDTTSGDLDFAYQFTNVPGGTGTGITDMTIAGFDTVKTDVGFMLFGSGFGVDVPLGQTPLSVSRSANGANITWSFLSGKQSPGTTSALLIVYTDALTWGPTSATFLDPGSASAATFAPVPEPETYAMILAGLGLTGFMLRRRRKQKAA